jgi:hypothetical protein
VLRICRRFKRPALVTFGCMKNGSSDSVKWNRLVTALMGVKLAPKLSNEGAFHSIQEPLLKSRGPCIDPVTKDVDGHLMLRSRAKVAEAIRTIL